ncbi:MAG: hypothetical protein KZQ97_09930 [Candidatus Thiodiazotropha sp. (ex Dulcina madagascariensis)]|nr:hypothetical protein [Candidatus Thiodiazotropha sp. (ex Dulcina madagascariensis)]
MQHQTPPPIKPHRAKEALVRGAIWGFIGLLYAILFVFFAILAEYWLLPIDPLFLAGILAGTFGALIYSSWHWGFRLCGAQFFCHDQQR